MTHHDVHVGISQRVSCTNRFDKKSLPFALRTCTSYPHYRHINAGHLIYNLVTPILLHYAIWMSAIWDKTWLDSRIMAAIFEQMWSITTIFQPEPEASVRANNITCKSLSAFATAYWNWLPWSRWTTRTKYANVVGIYYNTSRRDLNGHNFVGGISSVFHQ